MPQPGALSAHAAAGDRHGGGGADRRGAGPPSGVAAGGGGGGGLSVSSERCCFLRPSGGARWPWPMRCWRSGCLARTRALSETNTALRREVVEREEAEEALRRAQAELVQAGKLSALGQMSAGISHELNQPLMAIRSYAENGVAFLDRARPEKARRGRWGGFPRWRSAWRASSATCAPLPVRRASRWHGSIWVRCCNRRSS